MDAAVAESLRGEHKPRRVRVAFVGESAPAGDTFFYAENSTLYHETRSAFERALPDQPVPEGFLERFERRGCYLDDLCLEPVNQLPDRERERRRSEAMEPLAERLLEYDPGVVVAIGKTTAAPLVLSALRHAGLADIPFHVVAFPGRPEHKADFHRELDTILGSIDWTRR
jgi:hypothetical protein